jgi:hypothetical protein
MFVKGLKVRGGGSARAVSLGQQLRRCSDDFLHQQHVERVKRGLQKVGVQGLHCVELTYMQSYEAQPLWQAHAHACMALEPGGSSCCWCCGCCCCC